MPGIGNGIVYTPENDDGLVIVNGVPATEHNGSHFINGVRVVEAVAALMDSYDIANLSQSYNCHSGADRGGGQSVTGNGGVLDYIKFQVQKKLGSPTGNCYAKVYTHSGTFGTSSVGDTLIATSDAVDISTFTVATNEWRQFDFSGANRIAFASGTRYFIAFEWDGGDASNYVQYGADSSSPSHGGNLARETPDGTWIAVSTQDLLFEIYTG